MSAQTKVGTHRPDTKRAQAKAATQAKVLAAAQEAFHHHGFEAVRMRELAKSAGMSTGAIFANWPSKAALFEAAMGEPAPDVEAFLERVREAPNLARLQEKEMARALCELAAAAEHLRRHLVGHHA